MLLRIAQLSSKYRGTAVLGIIKYIFAQVRLGLPVDFQERLASLILEILGLPRSLWHGAQQSMAWSDVSRINPHRANLNNLLAKSYTRGIPMKKN